MSNQSNEKKLVKVTYIAKKLIKINKDGIPFIVVEQNDKESLCQLQKTIRTLIALSDTGKKGPGRPSQSPKNVFQRQGVTKQQNDKKNAIEVEIHYPEAFQKFVCNVLKTAGVYYVNLHFRQDSILLYGDGNGGQSRLEMEINCNHLLRYYCQEEMILCVQRDNFDMIKTLNGKIHNKIIIYVREDNKEQKMYIMADIGSAGDAQFDVKMSLVQVEKTKDINKEMIQQYISINLESKFLKNYFANTSTANQTDFILKHHNNNPNEKIIPCIIACNNHIDDSKTLEKTHMIGDGKYDIFVNKPLEVRIKTNFFKNFIATLSRFASTVQLNIGKNKETQEGMILFEMHCDNEENNIFSMNDDEVETKITKLYGDDYVCRCYCLSKNYLTA